MADENNQGNSSGGSKGLIIALIALVVALFIAVIGGMYFLYTQTQNMNSNNSPQEQSKEVVDNGNYFKADINELVLNLTDSRGREKLMKLSFSIKSAEPNIVTIIEDYKAEIIDVVISQISARSSEELLTVGGKNLLKDEMIQDINNVLNSVASPDKKIPKDCVKTILFTTFVIK